MLVIAPVINAKQTTAVVDAGFLKGGSRKGSEHEARAEILAMPPQQLVIDQVEFCQNHRACAY